MDRKPGSSKQQLAILFSAIVLLLCVFVLRTRHTDKEKVNEARARMMELVDVGDDIFDAKETLLSNDFRIVSGPNFATADKDYYLMTVDFGVLPSTWDTIQYTIGMRGSGEPIAGIVKANSEGVITNVR